MPLPLHPSAFYGEAELVRELGVSRRALRRSFPALIIGKRRVYRGADILCATAPATASASTAVQGQNTGGLAAILPAKEDASGAGRLASPSSLGRKSQRASLDDWRKNGPAISPIRPRRQ